MNERTQTRLAWVLSASLLAAGWFSRYLPETGKDAGSSCTEAAPRAVALVVPEPTNSDEGERVYVYWLNSPEGVAAGERTVATPRAPNETPRPDSDSGWQFVGSTLLGEQGSVDPLPIR